MSAYWETGRCVCGCPHARHDHYRRGTDCGQCGKAVCRRYVPLASRDSAILTAAQRVALADSDMRVYRNLMALSLFALSTAPVPVPRSPSERPLTRTDRLAVAQAIALRKAGHAQRQQAHRNGPTRRGGAGAH